MKKIIILTAIALQLNAQNKLHYRIVANSFTNNQTIKKLSPQWLDFEAVGTWTKSDSTSFSGNVGTFRMYSIGYTATLMIRSVSTYNFLYNIGVKNENPSFPKSKRLHYTLMPTTYTGQVKLEDGWVDRFAMLGNETYTGIVIKPTTPSPIVTVTSPLITILSPVLTTQPAIVTKPTVAGVLTVPSDVIIDSTIVRQKDTITAIDQIIEVPYKVEYYDLNGNKSDKKGLFVEIKYYISRSERRKILIIE